jgi:pimeloyl-ACP methyl ester carboxylesterase
MAIHTIRRLMLVAAATVGAASCIHTSAAVSPPPASDTMKPPPPPPPPKPPVATAPDGVTIAYERQGSGPPLILLHGAGQTRRSWYDRGYVSRLEKSFTVITMDERGTGGSGKPRTIDQYALDRVLGDVLAVADAAGATKFHVWGFGRGATIARYLAARSDRVISAVLVGNLFGPPVAGTARQGMIAMRDRWQPLLAAKDAGTLDESRLSAGAREALNGDTPITALAGGAVVDYPPLEPSAIRAPTLWIVGADDGTALPNAKDYRDKLKETPVTLKILDGASYTDCFVHVDELVGVAKPFLAGAASTTSTAAAPGTPAKPGPSVR